MQKVNLKKSFASICFLMIDISVASSQQLHERNFSRQVNDTTVTHALPPLSSIVSNAGASKIASTFGDAVKEIKRDHEESLKQKLDSAERRELSRLPSGSNIIARAEVQGRRDIAPLPAAPIQAPILVGLSGAKGRYSAEWIYENTHYHASSDELPKINSLWTVVEVSDKGVRLTTKTSLPGLPRKGEYTIRPPSPGAPIPKPALISSDRFQLSTQERLSQPLPQFR